MGFRDDDDRYGHADEWREEENRARWEREEAKRISRENWRARMDPGYVPSWEREEE